MYWEISNPLVTWSLTGLFEECTQCQEHISRAGTNNYIIVSVASNYLSLPFIPVSGTTPLTLDTIFLISRHVPPAKYYGQSER